MLDRRQAKRYRVSVPAAYRWNISDSSLSEGTGITRDASMIGAFVFARVHPPVGAHLQLEISLSNLDNTGPGMLLRGSGKVLRTAQGDESEPGFAAFVEFCDDLPLTSFGHKQQASPTQVHLIDKGEIPS